ncbi:MAG: NADAR family protein [Bacteroidetes bacterium]|nr:NADAR family protein [Bacteroidota bacterium]
MNQHYTLSWLQNKFDRGETPELLFFWGHKNNQNQHVGRFCFSQWFELPFIVDDVAYPTAEHWMMANKALLFGNQNIFDKIIKATKPGEVKELGRQVLGFDETIWNNYKYEIVKQGNIHKFNQHPKLASYLIQTGDKILVEASPTDIIWGIGLSQDDTKANDPHQWRGSNLLGFVLMEVRDFLHSFGHFEYIKSTNALPWKINSDIDPRDFFWQMGHGEEIIANFNTYYNNLTDRDKLIFKLSNPAPYNWRDLYN